MTTATLEKRNTRSIRRNVPFWSSPLDRFYRNEMFNYFDGDGYLDRVPSMNIRETKSEFVIDLAAPGLKREDFNLNVEGTVLTIKVEGKSPVIEAAEEYTCTEYDYSNFTRTLTLPEFAETTKIDAQYRDGILHISVPKKPESQKMTQKIKVQ